MFKPLILMVVACLAAIPHLYAAPTIAAGGVKNAASYANSLLPNGAIAEGSIFNIFGSAMGPAAIAYASALPLPTTLSGTAVNVTVSGITVQCFMVYTSAGQVAAILPSSTPVGTGTISVSYNGAASPTAPITVAKSAFGIFTLNQQGSGPAVIQDGNYQFNSTTFAFQPGETVVLWGTGLGPISGSDANTPPTGNIPGITVSVMVGGVPATVTYAGRSGYSGDDQVAFTIPQGVTGCFVPLILTVSASGSTNVVYSNSVMISIDATTTCSSPSLPTGLTGTGGNVRDGSILLDRNTSSIATALGPIVSTGDVVEGSFNKIPSSAFSGGYDLAYGQCAIVNSPPAPSVTTTPLDAGPVLNISGPNGNKQVPVSTFAVGSYYTQLGGGVPLPGQTAQPLYLSPGNYTVDNGSGGADVGGFKVNITVPAIFTWTNMSQITTINRSQPLTFTWTGGDPNADVTIAGGSGASAAVVVTFICKAHNSAGSLTVPTFILQALPPAAVIGGIPLGSLQIQTSTSVLQSPPSGLDLFPIGDTQGGSKTGIAVQ